MMDDIYSTFSQQIVEQLEVTQAVILSEMYKLNNFLCNGPKEGLVDQYIASLFFFREKIL